MAERFTRSQRQAILKRDGYTSQLKHYDESRGWYTGCDICPLNPEKRKLQVHHIEPNRISENGGNESRNLITVYQCEHTGVRCDGGLVHGEKFVIHTDVTKAVEGYRKGDKKAFFKLAQQRNEKVKNGEAYWNTDHDEIMKETAEERTSDAAAKGWRFPIRKKR